MKNILLIGDSIRMGYDKAVKKSFEGIANVVFPEDNCRFASYVLRYFHEYTALIAEFLNLEKIPTYSEVLYTDKPIGM